MSGQEPIQHPVTLENHPHSLGDMAALENFMRLQRSQAEYLAWLEASERKTGLDRYIYRQIR